MKAEIVYRSLRGSIAAVGKAIAGADQIVAGAPVHCPSIPTEQTGDWARAGSLGPGGVPADPSHPKMRSWLGKLPKGGGGSAACDTRVQAWYGWGEASKIAKALRQMGYRPRLWGAGLAKAMKKRD